MKAKFVNEVLQYRLFEVGQGTSKTFSYKEIEKKSHDTGDEYTIEFNSDKGKYLATILSDDGSMQIHFNAIPGQGESENEHPDQNWISNRGEVLKVISTVTKIGEEYAEKINPDSIYIFSSGSMNPDPEKKSDLQRINLYRKFVEKRTKYKSDYFNDVINKKIQIKDLYKIFTSDKYYLEKPYRPDEFMITLEKSSLETEIEILQDFFKYVEEKIKKDRMFFSEYPLTYLKYGKNLHDIHQDDSKYDLAHIQRIIDNPGLNDFYPKISKLYNEISDEFDKIPNEETRKLKTSTNFLAQLLAIQHFDPNSKILDVHEYRYELVRDFVEDYKFSK